VINDANCSQFLFILDVTDRNPVDVNEVERLLPTQRRNLFTNSIAEYGAERSAPTDTPNWPVLRAALARMVTCQPGSGSGPILCRRARAVAPVLRARL